MVIIKPLTPAAFSGVIALANRVHGPGYLDWSTLSYWQQLAQLGALNANFVALAPAKAATETENVNATDHEIIGYRLCFRPGSWQPDQWCSPELWSVEPAAVAYFKSVAIAPDWQGQGIGQLLLREALRVLKAQGAQAGLAHLWQQSPNNSAVRYFSKAGGRLIKTHPNRWQHLSADGYCCPRCGNLCCCSAAEMLLEF